MFWGFLDEFFFVSVFFFHHLEMENNMISSYKVWMLMECVYFGSGVFLFLFGSLNISVQDGQKGKHLLNNQMLN